MFKIGDCVVLKNESRGVGTIVRIVKFEMKDDTNYSYEVYYPFSKETHWFNEDDLELYIHKNVKNIEVCGGEPMDNIHQDQKPILDKAAANMVISIVHNTIYDFFDFTIDEMNEQEKLLLKINKAICNNIKSNISK